MSGGKNGSQPVHIRTDACANLDPVAKCALTNVVRESSTTTISGITLGDLLNSQYVIDVHESSADIKEYIACTRNCDAARHGVTGTGKSDTKPLAGCHARY